MKSKDPAWVKAMSVIYMWESMNTAIGRAGGMGFTFRELEEMSAAELLLRLAPNRVIFAYRPSEEL